MNDRMLVLNSDHDRAVLVQVDLAKPPNAAALFENALPLAAIGLEM